ncbi:hypothetical protein MMC30_006943 [Trapelia coarctata]|nr:hypothetical protein [Trapelia coarctata]
MAHSSRRQSFYDGSFTLYRLSPLYYARSASLLLPETLLLHSRRFTESLKGDVLRGVYVGLGEGGEVSIASGSLKTCQWTLLDPRSAISDEDENQGLGFPGLEGIKVDAQYEKTTYTALLLRNPDSTASRDTNQIYLPLLMIRMPPALRDSLIAYIGTTFDTRIEPMRLSSYFMGHMLEQYLEESVNAGSEQFEKMMKSIQLVLGFKNIVAPDLKALSIDIRREEVTGFITKGKALIQKASSGGSAGRRVKQSGEGDKQPRPFMTAMKKYIAEQTSLDIEHKDISLSKLSCGGFALSADGKVRFLAPIPTALTEDGLPESQLAQGAIAGMMEQLLAEASARSAQSSD